MKRKYKRRTSRFGIFFVFLTAVTIAGVFFIPWAMKPDNFRNEKNKINSWLNGIFFQDFYNAKSLILVDLSNALINLSTQIDIPPIIKKSLSPATGYFGHKDEQSHIQL